MTGAELHFQEVATVKDGSLDAQVSQSFLDDLTTRMGRQAELLKDGLSSGFSARLTHAQEHLGETAAELGIAAGLGGAMTLAMKAGGKWSAGAKVAGSFMLLGMGADITRRAVPTFGAMADTWRSGANLEQNKQIVGHYAGSALFDYPLMFAGGAAGAGAVHFGPRAMRMFERTPLSMEPQGLQPAFALEPGRLGAKEALADPLAATRKLMEQANPKKSMSLAELGENMTVRRAATHEQTSGLWNEMVQGLERIDQLKPQLAAEQTRVTGLERQLADLSAAKAETTAVTQARGRLDGLSADQARLPELRHQADQIRAQLRPPKPDAAADAAAPKKGKDAPPPIDRAALSEQLADVNGTIRSITERAGQRQALEAQLAAAEEALAARRSAIEQGTAPDITTVSTELQAARAALEAKQAEMGQLTTGVSDLTATFSTKLNELRPTLTGGSLLTTAEVRLPKKAAQEAPAPRVTESRPPARPQRQVVELAPAKPAAAVEPVREVRRPVQERPAQPPRQERAAQERPADRRNDGVQRAPERGRQPERRVEETVPAERVITGADVSRAAAEAERAVADFVGSRKRHTTALKAVETYVSTFFESMRFDAKAGEQSAAVLRQVEGMLGKMDNWQRGASWFRRDELSQIRGVTPEQMGRFNQWYDTVKGNYTPQNGMPEIQLNAIQTHLQNRVAVESVKHWLRTAPDTQNAISPVVQTGFEMMRSGQLPTGKPVPEGSSMIVLVERAGPDGPVIAPFAKDGRHMQWFDGNKIAEGLRKQEIMQNQGPSGLTAEELYGFRLDHDPSRLIGTVQQQAGFAILRPGGQWGKNIAYYELAPSVDAALLPRNFRMDGQGGAGTNTGVLFNLLRNLSGQANPGAAARPRPAAPAPEARIDTPNS